jgi:hypothetical protein
VRPSRCRGHALDNYSWVTDFPALGRWLEEEKAAGRNPNNYAPPGHVLEVENAPGRKPFDVTNSARQSGHCYYFNAGELRS